MASDLMSFIPRSLDEKVVKSSQNAGMAASAKVGAGIVDADAENKLKEVQGASEIQKQSDLAQIMLANKINEVNGALTKEVDGTRGVLELQERVFEEKLGTHLKQIQDTKGYSFFTNPIATIRNHVVKQQQVEQLNDITDAMNAGRKHIDNQYAQAAQEVQDFRATVLNVNQANLNLKAHELQAQTKEAQVAIEAAEKKRQLATQAIGQQQFVTDPSDKAGSARDKALLDNLTYKAMFTMANNGSEKGWSPEMATVMAQQYESIPPEKRAALGRVATKLNLLPAMERKAEETDEQFNERNVQRVLAVAGEYDGPEVAELGASLGTTRYNPLYKLGNDTVNTQLMATAEESYAQQLGVTPELMTAAQRQMSYKVAKARAETLSAKDKISAAAASIQQDLTARATMSNSAIPPFDHAGSAELMASANVNPVVAEWFKTDAAKQSINNWIVHTGKQAPDVAINIMDGLQEVTLPNGKKLEVAERAKIAAKYIEQMYIKDYTANGEHGEAFTALQMLSPNSRLRFKAGVKLPRYGNEKEWDLTNPEDLINLKSRVDAGFEITSPDPLTRAGVRFAPPT